MPLHDSHQCGKSCKDFLPVSQVSDLRPCYSLIFVILIYNSRHSTTIPSLTHIILLFHSPILNNILSSPEEETEVEIETESSQGPEESEGGGEDSEDSESYENSENPVNPENSVNLEGLSSGNEGIERLTVENPKEIQDGESITIRRDPSAPTNRFF